MWVHVYVVPYLHAPLCATGIERAISEGRLMSLPWNPAGPGSDALLPEF